MTITKENYETWMLDYLEGKLLGKQLAVFEAFLSEHPELKEAADGVDKVTLATEEKFFGDKTMLKAKMLKQVIDEEEQTCFDAVEGTLSNDKKSRLEKRLESSSRLKQKLEQYHEARLMPDYKIVFPDKASLKRSETTTKGMRPWMYLAAAASIAGIIYLAIAGENPIQEASEKQAMSQVKQPNSKEKKVYKQPLGSMIKPAETVTKPEKVEPASQSVISQPNQPKVMVGTLPSIIAPKKQIKKPEKTVRPSMAPVTEPTTRFAEATKPVAPAKPVVVPASRKPANKPIEVAQPNVNFVYDESLSVSSSHRLTLPFVKVGTRILEKVSGERLSVKRSNNKSTRVTFDSKLVSFETNIRQ